MNDKFRLGLISLVPKFRDWFVFSSMKKLNKYDVERCFTAKFVVEPFIA